MPSVFTRKSKTKPVAQLQTCQTTGYSAPLNSPLEGDQLKCPLKPSLTYSSTLNRIAVRASSASPRPHSYGRRLTGVTVTFESTLPTQVWQASPSPSPPSISPTAFLRDNRMIVSVSDDWSIRESCLENHKPSSLLPKQSKCRSASFPNWLSHEADTDDSSDGTSPSGLTHQSMSSTCSSSDESIIVGVRQVRHKNSSSTATATTDSSSSLDMRLVRAAGDSSATSTTKIRRRLHASRTFGTEKRGHKKNEEKKRRPVLLSAGDGSGSSSSSSSEDDDLEALGWDEKTISAAMISRSAKGRKHVLSGLPVLNTNSNGKSNNKKLPVVQKPQKTNGNHESTSSVNFTVQSVTQLSHPQSCLLVRRHNKPGVTGPINYTSPTVLRSGIAERSFRTVYADSKRTFNTELLAVITNDYKPLSEWEQEYKVLPVRKGEHVCVLSQPMQSRPTNGTSNNHHKLDHSRDNNESNTWLYVRRWCVDHLVATGPPGFVPRHHCRLLPSKEILGLWQQSQLFRSNNGSHFTTPTDMKSKVMPVAPTASELSDLAHLRLDEQSKLMVRYPFVRPSVELDTFHPAAPKLMVTHPQVPPPPAGFGSGCSFGGSETEDRDSGRGPSSGSEWSSGKGGSLNVTLDRSTAVDKTRTEAGLQIRSDVQSGNSSDRCRNANSAEESQLGWYTNDGSVFSSGHSSNREEDVYSQETVAQTSSTSGEPPHLQVSSLSQQTLPKQSTNTPPSSVITLTTCTGHAPVLELRTGGTPTLHAKVTNNTGTDSLVTSTTTCTTVVDSKAESSDTDVVTSRDSMSSVNPALWEPYKTVIHVNENSMEKFTLV
ncbi:hypothetical protein CRM22_001368 [Opisthorchis felineus]|uniref:Uncharacterized protein n=1 Tax=Opisthorchis felineus TaxID=147828 RepID=A0A4S2MAR6_OPIFE|nr:hypothetical protein CRM22_001368 [Opisthorchis felineus]